MRAWTRVQTGRNSRLTRFFTAVLIRIFGIYTYPIE